jgi:hypothetical protein
MFHGQHNLSQMNIDHYNFYLMRFDHYIFYILDLQILDKKFQFEDVYILNLQVVNEQLDPFHVLFLVLM